MSDYDEYLEVLDEIEKIEEIITPPKYRRCCHDFVLRMLQHRHSLLELFKSLIMYMKFKSN